LETSIAKIMGVKLEFYKQILRPMWPRKNGKDIQVKIPWQNEHALFFSPF